MLKNFLLLLLRPRALSTEPTELQRLESLRSAYFKAGIGVLACGISALLMGYFLRPFASTSVANLLQGTGALVVLTVAFAKPPAETWGENTLPEVIHSDFQWSMNLLGTFVGVLGVVLAS